MRRGPVLGVLLVMLPVAALAQPYSGGPGAIVLVNGAEVYAKAQGDDVVDRLKRGDAVIAGTPTKPMDSALAPDIVTDRLMVTYFHAGKSSPVNGWMKPTDLSRFALDKGCFPPGPIMPTEAGPKWSPCFEQARDAKLAELGLSGAPAAAPAEKKAPDKP
jgi:hypothetical protein